MPKYKPAKVTLAGWVLLFLVMTPLIIISIFTIWKHPILLGIVVIWIGIASYVFNRKHKKKFLRMKSIRMKQSICDFARSFDCRQIDTWIIRAVFEELQRYVSISDNIVIPIKAEDRIVEDLKVDEEDLEYDILEVISQRTGRTLLNTKENPYYSKINTVSDLVYFFNNQPIGSTISA